MVKIEEGKFYRTRDGKKVGPMAFSREEGIWFVHRKVGRWESDGSVIETFGWPDPSPLISEWSEGPVRTVTRREVVCGSYGRVIVDRVLGKECVVAIDDWHTTMTANELRSAAMIFSQLAEALDDTNGDGK